MRKKILLVGFPLVLLLVFLAVPAFAKDTQSNGSPFDELWTAIRTLEAKVTGLEADATPDIGFSAYIPRNPINPPEIIGDGGYQVIAFEGINFNDGSAYDPASGNFTVPASGVYHFDFGIYNDPSGLEILSVNGSAAVPAYPVLTMGNGGSVTLKLNAGDTVQVRATSGAGASLNAGWFAGYRVY